MPFPEVLEQEAVVRAMLLPAALGDPEQAVRGLLDRQLFRRLPEGRGILLGFSDLRLCGQAAALSAQSAYAHLRASARLLVFRVSPGDTVFGTVTALSAVRVGILIRGAFNGVVEDAQRFYAYHGAEQAFFRRGRGGAAYGARRPELGNTSQVISEGAVLRVVVARIKPSNGALSFLCRVSEEGCGVVRAADRFDGKVLSGMEVVDEEEDLRGRSVGREASDGGEGSEEAQRAQEGPEGRESSGEQGRGEGSEAAEVSVPDARSQGSESSDSSDAGESFGERGTRGGKGDREAGADSDSDAPATKRLPQDPGDDSSE